MIDTQRYNEIIQEIHNNCTNSERVIELVTELGYTKDVYKKSYGSNYGDVDINKFVLVGKLTTRNELILLPPVRTTINLNEVKAYERCCYHRDTSIDDNGEPYIRGYTLVDREPFNLIDEVRGINDEWSVMGYKVPVEGRSGVFNFTFYD